LRRSVTENNLGSARLVLGDVEGAIGNFRQAIIDNPSYSDAYSNLGIAFAMHGNTADAIEQLQIALRLNPADGETRAFLNNLTHSGRTVDGAR
jgi:tetratricopeptide (TPR) repeat protein